MRRGADANLEAAILARVVPSLAQAVLDNSQTPLEAFQILACAIDRALP